MTRILVVYATTEGHTARIARRVSDRLSAHDAIVDVVAARETHLGPSGYDGIIVAASVHTGTYQPEVRHWVRRYAPLLNDMPTAFVSVCLGVLQKEPEVQAEVAAIVDRFLNETGWRPTFSRSVAGAVLYTQYGWIKRRLMRHIVWKAGGPTDITRDYVFTDWTDVDRLADTFGAEVARRLPVFAVG
jgi:menaquinone-dependent protoporphyrinogen oxidase